MNSNKISLVEARKLAKYYGRLVQTEDEYGWSEDDKMKHRGLLCHYRSLILKKCRKNENKTHQTTKESNETTS